MLFLVKQDWYYSKFNVQSFLIIAKNAAFVKTKERQQVSFSGRRICSNSNEAGTNHTKRKFENVSNIV
jgi:hypothetical protein